MLELASLTDSLVTLATNIINDLGLAGVALLTFTSAVIGLPGTEPTMLFAGFNVYQGHLTLLGIIVAGLIGDMVGASIAYAIGYFGRRELLERHGSKLHVSQQAARHRPPLVRAPRLAGDLRLATDPGGQGGVPLRGRRRRDAAIDASSRWPRSARSSGSSASAILGRAVGSNWQNWRHHLEIVDYMVRRSWSA